MSLRLTRSRRLSSVLEAVGNTPLIRLEKVAASAPGVEVYVKLEFMNPGGSVKDRPAMRMMLDAIKDGRLTQDRILIDSTSGNTGVAYSLMGAALGYRVHLVMPSNVTKARKDITQAFGTHTLALLYAPSRDSRRLHHRRWRGAADRGGVSSLPARFCRSLRCRTDTAHVCQLRHQG